MPEKSYSELSPDERRVYHRKAAQKTRGTRRSYANESDELRRDVEVLEVIIAHLQEKISEGLAVRMLRISRVDFRDRMIRAVQKTTGESEAS